MKRDMHQIRKLEVSVQGVRGAIFVLLSTLCCAVLMCASSCNRSDLGKTWENRLGTHNAATKGSDTARSTGDYSFSSVTDLDSLEYALEPGRWCLFKILKVDLDTSENNHYNIKLDDMDVDPGTFGKLVLIVFSGLDSCEYSLFPSFLGSVDNTTHRRDAYLCLCIALGGGLRSSDYLTQLYDGNLSFDRELCDSKDESDSNTVASIMPNVVVSSHIRKVLVELVEKDLYKDSSCKGNYNGFPVDFNGWKAKYGKDNRIVMSDSDMDKMCFCLGQDIIDELGAQMNKRNMNSNYVVHYDPKFREKDKKSGRKGYWLSLGELSLRSGNSIWAKKVQKTSVVYTLQQKKSGLGLGSFFNGTEKVDVSFGFQTIAEIAKEILCQNFVLSDDVLDK